MRHREDHGAADARWVAGLLFLSGWGSLVLQVGWMREFRLVFGATTAASAAVVAIFMGGLGLGSVLWGPRADRSARPLRLYAMLELGIFLSGVVTPWAILLVRAVYIWLGGQGALGFAGASVIRLMGAAVVLAIPTVLMGGTLPAAVRAVTRPRDGSRRAAALLYAMNTLGAVAGAASGTFWLLPAWGTRTTIWVACLIELTVFIGAWWLSRRGAWSRSGDLSRIESGDRLVHRRRPASGRPRSVGESAAERPVPHSWIYAAAAIVGFAFFLMELVWYRMLGPILGGTTYTFGLLLAMALLGIGLGSASYVFLFRRRRPTLGTFAVTCALEALCVAIPFALGDRIAIQAAVWAEQGPTFAQSVVNWSWIAALVVLPASLVSGIQYPMLVALLGEGRQQIGAQIGRCGAWNTVGAIAGTLAGGFGVLPLLTAPGAWRLVVALLAATGLVAALLAARGRAVGSRLTGWRQVRRYGLPLAIGLVAASLTTTVGPTAVWRHSGVGAGRFTLPRDRASNPLRDWMHGRRRRTIWEADGVEASIGLVADNSLAFYVNGKSDGDALGDAGTQIMLGLLPALFHPAPTDAMVVGLGTGESAGWLAEVASIRQVDVVELEPAVDEMARRCAAVNFRVLEHPKVHRVYNDAREVLMTTRKRYDLIVSEPSNPYRAGVASLFTREFYSIVRRNLESSGLFVQWLQAYEVDEQTVRTVIATLRSVFPSVEIWQSQRGDLLLVCSEPLLARDAGWLRGRMDIEPFRSGLAYAWRATDLEGVLARHVAGPALADAWSIGERPVLLNTDDHNVVEYGFARTVGEQTGFSVEAMATAARQLGAGRAPVEGPIHERLVEDHRQVLRALWHGDLAPGTGSRLDQTSREQFLRAYANADTRRMLQVWEATRYEPVFPSEVTLLALAYADSADDRAVPLIERLRSPYPVEAGAIEAHLRWRQGDVAAAAELLGRVFLMLREHPWGMSHVIELCFLAAEDVSRQDPRHAATLFAALSQPFAVHAYDNERLTAVHGVAYSLHVAAVVQTIEALEPWVPWSERFLVARHEAYRTTDHPLTSRARRDLDSFRRAAQPVNRPSIALQSP